MDNGGSSIPDRPSTILSKVDSTEGSPTGAPASMHAMKKLSSPGASAPGRPDSLCSLEEKEKLDEEMSAQRHIGESDGSRGASPRPSPTSPGLHPFIQTLIQQQQIQRLNRPPNQDPQPPGPNPDGHNPRQEWLRAAALSSLLPGFPHHSHPLLKNFPHGHAQTPPHHQLAPKITAGAPSVIPSRMSSGPQPFAPEFFGLVNHFNSNAPRPTRQQHPVSMPPTPSQSGMRRMSFSLANSCVVCRRPLEPGDGECLVLDSLTLTASNISISEKLEDIVGFSLSALGRSTDYICKRCMGLVSLVDRMELELSAAKEQVVILFRQGNFGDVHYFHRHEKRRRFNSGDDNLEHLNAKRRCEESSSSKINGGEQLDGRKGSSAASSYFPSREAEDLLSSDGRLRMRRQSSQSDLAPPPAVDGQSNERTNFLISGSSESECGSKDFDESDSEEDVEEDDVSVEGAAAPIKRESKAEIADGIMDLSKSSSSETRLGGGAPQNPEALQPRINCELCDESFNKSHHFEYHLNKVHLKEAPYLCNVCKKTFFSDFALTTHMGHNLHFATPEERLLHISEDQSFFDAVTQAVRWKCLNCRHTSKSKTALRFHVANAHVPPRGKHLCQRCGRGFMQEPALEAHMNKEHARRSGYPCDDCEKVFLSGAALRAHKLAKQGDDARDGDTMSRRSITPPVGAASSVFPCFAQEHPQPVNKYELTSANVESGGSTHAPPPGPGQAPVVACPLCLMLFQSEGSLMQHQRSGSCPGAITRFNPFAAAAVASQQHGPPPPHHLPPRHPLLDARPPVMTHPHLGVHPHHMHAPHPPPSPTSAHAAIMMNQIKSFLCRTCGEAYRTKDALDRHLWLVHSIKAENVVIYRCDECGKEYTKKQRYDTHMMLHRGERPHRCPYCKYDTNIRGNLRLHVKNVHKVELPLMRRKRGQD